MLPRKGALRGGHWGHKSLQVAEGRARPRESEQPDLGVSVREMRERGALTFRVGSWDWGVMEVWGAGEGAQKGPEAGHSESCVAPPERRQREQWGVSQPGRLVEGEGWVLAWEALQTEWFWTCRPFQFSASGETGPHGPSDSHSGE